jgi:DNA-directed RNA polymerase specialized sigma subunit
MENDINKKFDSIFSMVNGKVDLVMNKVKLSEVGKKLSDKERTVVYLVLGEKFSPKELAEKLYPNQGEGRIKQIFIKAINKLGIKM